MKTLYEVHWHSINDEFTHCSITPLTVIREGVLPGCSGVSITAKDASGRVFLGSPRDYFHSEEEVWKTVVEDLESSRSRLTKTVAKIARELEHLDRYLGSLRK